MAKITIEAGRTRSQYWADIWAYREVFYTLAWRDVLVRYKQTMLGSAWALIRPALTMVILSVIFGRVAKLPSGGLPYPVLVLAAMLPWQFISSVISDGSQSIVTNERLIGKVYFPRVLVPLSVALAAALDFLITLVLLAIVMIYYGVMPGLTLLAIIPLSLAAAVAALGPTLILSALNVKYRDVRYIVPFVVQFGMYVSPVGFDISVVPEQWRRWFALNPAVHCLEGFRYAVCGRSNITPLEFSISLTVSLVLLYAGLRIFRKTEQKFADLV